MPVGLRDESVEDHLRVVARCHYGSLRCCGAGCAKIKPQTVNLITLVEQDLAKNSMRCCAGDGALRPR
jgi:hypothetical protein